MRKSEVRSEKGQSLEERPRGEEPERLRKCEPESVPNTRWNGGVVELGEVVQERLTRRSDAESGRKNGEFVPWRPGKSEPNSDRRGKLEVEKKEKCDGWGKWQVEKIGGEIDKSHYSGSERSRKAELVKCELVPENNSSYLKKVEVERRGGDGEKSEFHGSGRRQRMELEEEEFILENSCRKKDGDRGSGIDNRKRPSLSSSLNCDSKKSSRAHEEEQDEFKHEASSGKVQDKDHFFERPVKRQCGEPESNGRKYHHQEISDISQLKSRRKTEENIPSRASYPERSNRNRPRLPSKVSSSNRHPSCRHHEPVLSLLGPDKQDQRDHKDRTPSNYDRSPVERVRHDYNRDHPIHKDRTLSRSGRSTSEKVRQYDNRDHRDHRDRTPSHSDHSTTERVRHHDNRDHYDHRDRTPSLSDRSPMGRARCHDRKGHSVYMNRIPSHSHRSPMGRALHHGQRDHPDHRDHTSCPMERVRHHDHKGRSLHDRRRAVVHRNRTPNGCGEGLDSRERNKKSGEGEKQRVDRHEERPGRRVSSGWDGSKISSLRHRNNRGGDTCFDDKPSKKPVSPDSVKEFGELSSPPAPPRPLPSSLIPSQLETDNVLDELPCMEEDMDICDTPPHDTIPVDSKPGKWFYLDHFGMEQGPSKLDDLKRLINTGILLSDHLIKHSDSDRWVTVENAASPLVQLNLPSIVSDSVTELASPPEASGKSLVGTVDLSLDSSTLVLREESELHDEPAALEFSQDFLIDERVEGLLKGYNVVNGKELEILGEALNMIFEHANWENWSCSEGFTRFQSHNFEALSCRRQELRSHEGFPREAIENRPVAHLEKDFAIPNTSSSDWFSARRSCMGGDWKRNDESGQDRFSKKKIVLNHGYPLCQMPKSAYEDPRWQQRDDLYYPSRIRKLEVPAWAFSFSEEDSDINNDTGKVTILRQMKPPIPKGVKGTILPVVQTNACVVKDQGSSLSRLRFKGSERHTRRSTRSHSAYGDRCSDSEEPSNSKKTRELELQRLQRCRAALNIPRDHVCTVDELSLDLGDWYYMDGAGHVHGHSSFSEFQDVVAKGTITQNSSVFRKVDNTRLPVLAPKASSYVEERDDPPADYSSTSNDLKSASDSFHDLHPQFIGYTRGKLHELVMKSYKNREFAAAINEVLDPWISAKQQKKEMDKHVSINSSTTKREDAIHEMFRDGSQFGKNACLLSDGDSEMKEDLHLGPKNDPSFDDLCGEADFIDDNIRSSGPENENWGLLNSCILARVFHFMKTDLKSLISSAATCKSWNLAVTVYKNLCTFVDMSSVGPRCTDSMFQSAMGGYEKKKLTSIVLAGCSNITSAVLEEVLSLFPCISIIDIRGCSQFKDLVFKFQNIKWIKSSSNNKSCEESYSNIKSLKQLTEKGYSTSKAFKDFGGHVDDCDGSGDLVRNEYNLVDRKDSSSHPFRQGVYKRSKLFDARNSAAVLSRDAQMRRWLHRKSENGYKKMEQFIVFNLKDIMKENRFEFFIPEVAKIEDRMRSGYYVRRGLASLKDDISRMCRDAFKAKNRGDAKDMKHIIMSFIRLAKNLEGNPRLLAYEKDDMLKTVKDAPEYSSTPRCRKKQIKVASEKDSNRINDISYVNGGTDSFDREIKSCLSKLKRRGMNSDCETSDDHGNNFSEEDDTSEGETTASDTESSDDLRLRGEIEDVKGNGYLTVNDSSASISDNRGWGARMTKASLVPPVTRKYEVIESYLVIEDEEEVKQKMQAALPDDYPAKLFAQKSGIEESDMEIPEVKEYKPRKMLGVEVIEQEVYGIDPYTHSLLLDSMFEEPDWVLVDKHKFIEEVLLRSLNKQVRHFTGTGNSPMVYPLRPVVEEIQKKAEADGDTHILILCRSILKAMQCRRDHNYVAYRKGLGVVCNKEEGFGKDDFVVDFLGEVYPAWKWFEKQDGIKSLQKNNQDPAPEFYNIYLERPKGDRDGYDLVVVDAMHKANYASRICHSCRPNCEAKVTAVDGQYQIGIYTVRPIGYGEEVTYDYNSITESKEEYEASVCLCGSQICRGSYLNLTGEGAFEKVLKECHGVLDRHKLLLEACEANFVSEEDYVDLGRAGLGTCLLAGLPDWLVAYSAHLVRFINFERSKLPEAILKHNLEEKKKFFADINFEVEESDAEVQAEGVYNTRLQNLALTLDRVKYVMRCVFGDPKKAPPPLEKLSSETLASLLWKGEGSLVEELLQSMAPHMDPNLLSDLKSKIRAHNPSGSRELRKSLLWLRDKLRDLPCNSKCRHDAAADVIHTYAFTKCFYKVREYKSFTSPPLYISPLDLGPKYIDKMGSGFQEYCKTYGGNYCLGQLIYWHTQTNADPDCRLARARRGCLSLPDVSSFYRKSHNKVHERVYDSRTLRFMLSRMEQQPQRPWPTDGVWVFKNSPRFFGSPMLDAVLSRSSLDKEMMQWLKCRPTLYHSM